MLCLKGRLPRPCRHSLDRRLIVDAAVRFVQPILPMRAVARAAARLAAARQKRQRRAAGNFLARQAGRWKF
jgi:hypothetical protein